MIFRMSKRRTALLAVLVLTATANVVFWSWRYRSAEVELFKLEPTGFALFADKKFTDTLPAFDPINDRWVLGGRPIDSLAPYLADSDPDGLAIDHYNGKYLLLSLPANASAKTYHQAIISLAKEGICQVGFLDESRRVAGTGQFDIRVDRIVQVTAIDGSVIPCRDRINSDSGR